MNKSFFNAKRVDLRNKIDERRKKCKTKEEEREFERLYLKPEPIPPYAGGKPVESEVSNLSVLIVFRKRADLERLRKFFPITKYIQASITNLDMLMAFIEELEKGRLVYDQRSKRFRHPILRNRKRSTTVAEGKS